MLLGICVAFQIREQTADAQSAKLIMRNANVGYDGSAAVLIEVRHQRD